MKLYNISILILCFSLKILGQTKINSDLIQATKTAFIKNPQIKKASLQIQDAEGSLKIQQSAFDYNLNSEMLFQNQNTSIFDTNPKKQYLDQFKTNTFNLTTGLRKRFRSGQIAQFDIKYYFNNNNFPFNQYGQAIAPYFGNHTGLLNFSITQPLLRDRGYQMTTASERVSKLYIEYNHENYDFNTSYEVMQIGYAYWNYLVAFKNYEVYIQNEKRVKNVLDITKELVKADKKPAGDLIQVEADLAKQESFTAIAKQNLYNAQLNYGRAIGLSNEESILLDIPMNPFTSIIESGYDKTLNNSLYQELALKNRNDIKGLKKIQESLEIQNQFSKNGLKPRLDLTGFAFLGSSTTGNGLDQSLASFTNSEGKDIGIGAKLTFQIPVNNNQAKGNFIKTKTELESQTISLENSIRNVNLNIEIALNNLHNRALVLEKTKVALNLYEQTFNNEQIKFQTGLTTLLNLILFQERLTYAQIEYNNAQQQFSNAILNLRNETGTLLSKEEKAFKIELNSFYTIPKI